MARMTLAYNAERTDVLCAQMSGLMRRQSLQHFQAPPNEIRANHKTERHFEKLNDKFGTAHREISSRRSPDLAASRLVLTASPLQQHFACRHQFTAIPRSDDGLVRLHKDTKRVRVSVSTLRLPLVHTQDGAIIERPGDLITFPVAVPQHECEGRVPFIVIEFQQSLAYLALGESLYRPKSTQ